MYRNPPVCLGSERTYSLQGHLVQDSGKYHCRLHINRARVPVFSKHYRKNIAE